MSGGSFRERRHFVEDFGDDLSVRELGQLPVFTSALLDFRIDEILVVTEDVADGFGQFFGVKVGEFDISGQEQSFGG